MTIHVSNLDLLCFMIAERLRKMQCISGMDLVRHILRAAHCDKRFRPTMVFHPVTAHWANKL